jgi:hypothetical protein
MIQSSYLRHPIDIATLPRVVAALAKRIRKEKPKYKAIAFRGMSGALVVPMLCLELRKPMIVCRKESEKSHGSPVEGWGRGGPYIIVDDFISSGSTVRGIMATLAHWYTSRIGYYESDDPERPNKPECAGIFLYLETEETPNLNGVPVHGFHMDHV